MPSVSTRSSFQGLLPVSIILGLFCLYACFPNQNPTSDAYDYAASVKWQIDLWHPHHLLYNVTGLVFYSIFKAVGISGEPIKVLQFMNALVAALALTVLWRILRRLQPNFMVQAGLLFFVGSGFATMRYSTENETYILPIFLSLLGSYYWIKFSRTSQPSAIFWAGFWAAISCLYHQVHFFWWLGFLISLFWLKPRTPRYFLLFLLPAFLVPLGYAVAMILQNIPFYEADRFVFRAFYQGTVETELGYQHLLLTNISLVRTFLEVHGRMFYLLQKNWLYLLPALFTLLLFIKQFKDFLSTYKDIRLQEKTIVKTHLLIFALHLLFAYYAVGNAEFMVMFPFLIAILIACVTRVKVTRIFYLSGSLLLWNMAYGILPNYLATYTNYKCLYSFIQKKPEAVLLLQDGNGYNTYHFYQSGKYHPKTYEVAARSKFLQQVVDSAQKENRPILTDFTREKKVFNRARLLDTSSPELFFNRYLLRPVQNCPTLYGDMSLYQVFNR